MSDEKQGSTPATGELSESDAISRLMSLGVDEDEPQPEAEAEAVPADDAAKVGDEAKAEQPEAEEQAEAQKEAVEEAEPDEEPVYTVKVRGGTTKVSLSELLAGYSRTADYQRKTQAVAEERRELAALKEQMEHDRQLLAQKLSTFSRTDEQEPDWLKLSEEDPALYVKERAKWDAKANEAFSRQREFEAQIEQRYQEHIRENSSRLTDLIPEWRDAAKFDAENQDLRKFALETAKLQPESLRWLMPEHWYILREARQNILRKAALKAAPKAKVPAPAPVVQKPGNVATKAEKAASEKAALVQRALKTGRDEDNIAALAQFLS